MKIKVLPLVVVSLLVSTVAYAGVSSSAVKTAGEGKKYVMSVANALVDTVKNLADAVTNSAMGLYRAGTNQAEKAAV